MEAVETFWDPEGFVLQDIKHSLQENRYYWIAKTASNRVITMRFVRRAGIIRIIGAAEWREFREISICHARDFSIFPYAMRD